MVLGLEALGREAARGADRLDDDALVLTTSGHAVDDDVAHGLGEFGESFLGCSGLVLELAHLGGELLGTGQQGGLLVTLGLGDLLAQTLLLGTGRLMGRDRVPASLIGGDELVDHRWVLTPGDLGTTDDVWICAQQLGVDHG